MKKWKIYSIVITVILFLVIVGICLYAFVFKETITEEEAKNIALRYADVSESNAQMLVINKDKEEKEYEIHFYDNAYEYEVDVNYNNGEIDNFEKYTRENIYINESSMTDEEAKAIAMQRVGKTADEVTFKEIKKDRKNGIDVYDVYFYDNEKNYEISIDLDTKNVISYKEDYMVNNTINNNTENNSNNVTTNTTTNNNTNTNINNNNEFIGTEKAKEIALNHAGISNSNDVRYIKTELDVDHNVSIYEIEFYYNQSEYEYKVNAVTGEIIKYEIGH